MFLADSTSELSKITTTKSTIQEIRNTTILFEKEKNQLKKKKKNFFFRDEKSEEDFYKKMGKRLRKEQKEGFCTAE